MDTLEAVVAASSVTAVVVVGSDGRRILAAGEPDAVDPDLDSDARAQEEGVGPLLRLGDRLFHAVRAEIPGTGDPGAFAIQWNEIQATDEARESLHDLIGSGARLFVGNADGSVWTDLVGPVQGPGVPIGQLREPAEYRATTGENRLGMVAPIRGAPWVVLVDLSHEIVVAPVRAFLARMAGLGLLFLLVGSVGAWFAAGRITRPLTELTTAVSAIADGGDRPPTLPTLRHDELGVLSRAFEEMAGRVLAARRGLQADVADRTRELTDTLSRLKNSERVLFQFLEALPIGIFVVERGGEIYYRNGAAERLLGPAIRDATSTSVLPTLHRVDEEGLHVPYPDEDRPLSAGLDGESSYVDDAFVRHGDRLVPLEIWTEPVYGGGGEVAYAIAAFSDITDRRAAEAAIRRARELAEASNRAKSDFLAKMSHELRTPLNSIIGFSEILLDQTFGSLNPKQEKHVSNVHTSGRQLLQLINEVLDLSKVEAGHVELAKEAVPVGPVLAEVAGMMGSLVSQKRIDLRTDVPEDLPILAADITRLKQILVNLVGNAIKFTPDKGEIRVSVRSVGDPPTRLEFSVSDTGIGIAPEDQTRIFEEFEQVRGANASHLASTGLGLTLTRRFVELHGGKVSVESEVDSGSTFTFWLPIDRGEVVSTPRNEGHLTPGDERPSTPAPREGGPLVLVVEDDVRAAELIVHYLKEAGYRVSVAETAEQALALARTVLPDAITLDMFLPDAHGTEVLARLRNDQATSEIPVIVVSISADTELGLALGAREWVVKPAARDELVAAVDEVVEGRSGPGSVLVVDDDEQIRELLADLLEARGYDVLSAAGGEEAVDLARSRTPDLILLDLVMPDYTGFRVIDELREWRERTDARIVVFSELDLTRDQLARLERDVEGIVSKGAGRDALLSELARVTSGPRRNRVADSEDGASSDSAQELAS